MLVPILLAVLSFAVYSGVTSYGFVNWDDPVYITENAVVQTGLSAKTAWWALTTAHEPYWHPVTWISHLADVSAFGLDPGAHHAVNAAIHALNSILVFLVLRKLTSRHWPSAFVAAVFAVHPLHVESVAWITERKDVLSGLFWLLTLWSYASYAKRPSPWRFAKVVIWFALAAMSKPMVVTLPAILVLIDFWPLKRGWRWKEKLPLLAVSAAVSAATVLIQTQVGSVAGIDALGVVARLSNAVVSYVRYLFMFFWPANLTAFYPLRPWPVAIVAGAVLLLVAISAFAWMRRRTQPYLLWGWLYYLVTLLPVIGLLQSGDQAVADRFMYLPMIGPLVMVTWGASDLAARYLVADVRRRTLSALAATVIVASAYAARLQAATWSDSVTLWEHSLAVNESNFIAHEKLGAALRDLGRFDDARASFERSRAVTPPNSPRFLAILDNLVGMTYLSQGRVAEAGAKFAAAVSQNPAFAEAQNNLGNALGSAGRAADALPHFEAAIQLKPDSVEPRIGRGGALLQLGRIAEAQEEFRRAVALAPALAETHNGLGSSLALSGDVAGAKAEYETAIRLKPALASAHFNLAVLFVKLGRREEARISLERSLAADPNYAQARQLLGALAR